MGSATSPRFGGGRVGTLAAAAILLGCASEAWARPADQPRRAAANKQATRTGAAVPKPTIIKLRCKYADFEFHPDGDTADVVDRNFGNAVVTTVAQLQSSPKNFVISWERGMSTLVGLRMLRYRYLVNRETGLAEVQSADEMDGLPSVRGSMKEQCATTR